MLCNIFANVGYGKFHGAKLVLGLVAQQFQFGGIEIEKRGKVCQVANKTKFLICELKQYVYAFKTYLCVFSIYVYVCL